MRFSAQNALAIHSRRHFIEKLHPCKKIGCSKIFQTKSELDRHLVGHSVSFTVPSSSSSSSSSGMFLVPIFWDHSNLLRL